MQKAADLINTNPDQKPTGMNSPRASTELSEKALDRFFMKMGAIFLNTWSSNFPTPDALKVGRAIWSEGLADLSMWQIGRGLKLCESRQGWPPVLGEFRRMALGLPTRGEAISNVLHQNRADPLSAEIIKTIGTFDLDNLPSKDIERRAGYLYDSLYESFSDSVAGETLAQITEGNTNA